MVVSGPCFFLVDNSSVLDISWKLCVSQTFVFTSHYISISSYIYVIYSPGNILEFLALLQCLLGGDRGRYLTHTALYLAGVVKEAVVIIRGVIFEFWALGFFEHPYFVAS